MLLVCVFFTYGKPTGLLMNKVHNTQQTNYPKSHLEETHFVILQSLCQRFRKALECLDHNAKFDSMLSLRISYKNMARQFRNVV